MGSNVYFKSARNCCWCLSTAHTFLGTVAGTVNVPLQASNCCCCINGPKGLAKTKVHSSFCTPRKRQVRQGNRMSLPHHPHSMFIHIAATKHRDGSVFPTGLRQPRRRPVCATNHKLGRMFRHNMLLASLPHTHSVLTSPRRVTTRHYNLCHMQSQTYQQARNKRHKARDTNLTYLCQGEACRPQGYARARREPPGSPAPWKAGKQSGP